MKINVPTKITIARIALVALLILLLAVYEIMDYCGLVPDVMLGDSGISALRLSAAAIFVLAASTDFLDGYLARKWNQVTTLGKFLDPIADKLLVDSLLVYLCLPFPGNANMAVPVFCTVIMIARDLVVDALRQVAASKGVVLAANVFGKAKTVAQMVAIPVVLLNGWPFTYFDYSWGYLRIGYILVYFAAALSLLSGVVYVYSNRKVFLED